MRERPHQLPHGVAGRFERPIQPATPKFFMRAKRLALSTTRTPMSRRLGLHFWGRSLPATRHKSRPCRRRLDTFCPPTSASKNASFSLVLKAQRQGHHPQRDLYLLPEGLLVGPTLDSLGANFGMAQLINAHLAVVGDMRLSSKADKEVLAENVLKLTGRSPFTVDRKFKTHWTGVLSCKLMLISNEMPHLKDASGALASRFLVFNTRASFYGKEQPELFEQKLKPELPGILLWALEGLQRYRKRGHLLEPDCAKELRKRLEHDGSPVLAFVEECLELNPSAIVRKDALYKAWKHLPGASCCRQSRRPCSCAICSPLPTAKPARASSPISIGRRPFADSGCAMNCRWREAPMPFNAASYPMSGMSGMPSIAEKFGIAQQEGYTPRRQGSAVGKTPDISRPASPRGRGVPRPFGLPPGW